MQCDDSWVRRRRLDADKNNRCPGEHSKMWNQLPAPVQAARWKAYRDAYGDPPEIPTQADVKSRTKQRLPSTDPCIPAQVAGSVAAPRILECCCSKDSRIGRDEFRGKTVFERLTEKLNLCSAKGLDYAKR